MPEVTIPGPEGRLEGRYKHNPDDTAPVALILHPHPSHGGTMNNTVTYRMFHAFADAGFSVLRFNFRGVGKSQGEFDRGEGELSDAASALDWLQKHHPNARATWVGGYNFGAWIGMQLLMRRPEISSFVSVALPANLFDFTFLAPCPNSGLVIQGNQDDIVPHDQVYRLVEKLRAQRGIEIDSDILDGANHFFTGKLPALADSIDAYINKTLLGLDDLRPMKLLPPSEPLPEHALPYDQRPSTIERELAQQAQAANTRMIGLNSKT